MITKLKAVLFDLDDTLFDRNRAQRKILHLIVREFCEVFTGIDENRIANAFIESERVAAQEFYAGGSVDVVHIGRSKRFLKMLGLSEEFAERITTMYVRSYPTINAPVRGAKLVIGNLARKFQLGVVSNGFPDEQYRKLKALNIKHLFDCIVLSGEIGIQKPNPRIFWKATALLARKPRECLYVGDSYETDIIGAKKAGMWTCWFNPGNLVPSQEHVKSDFEISVLDEILRILGCA